MEFVGLREDLIIYQYRNIVGALDKMFKEMGKRSEIEAWRIDGVGTCSGMSAINKTVSEFGITGLAREKIILLREERASQFPGRSSLTWCPLPQGELWLCPGRPKKPGMHFCC